MRGATGTARRSRCPWSGARYRLHTRVKQVGGNFLVRPISVAGQAALNSSLKANAPEHPAKPDHHGVAFGLTRKRSPL